MRRASYILWYTLIFTGLWWGCEEEINQPATVQFRTTVRVIDTTFVTEGIFGNRNVPGASVELQAVHYQIGYQRLTDNRGIALFEGLIPDVYNSTVRKIYPEDTVLKYLGIKQEQVLVASVPTVQLAQPGDSFTVVLKPVTRAPFVFSELYYNGAKPPPGFYYHDQFTEIYNNSASIVYIDGYVIGDAIYGYRDDPEYVHCEHLYQFPGSGTDYPVAPGDMIVIAQDAIDHTEISPNSIDLSKADFEYYNPQSNDVDNPNVVNMIQIHHEYGFDYLYSVMNDAIILAKLEPEDTLTYDSRGHILVPIKRVVDAIEYKEDPTNYEYKYLSDVLDAGITGGLAMYQGKSVIRKIFKIVDGQIILMDNNNSSIDFKVTSHRTPGWIDPEDN